MNAIIARPATGARPGHARKKINTASANSAQPGSEAERLCRAAVGIVSLMVEQVVDHTGDPAIAPIASLDEADCLLMYMHDPAGHEGLAAFAGELGGQLRRAYCLLDCVVAEIPERWSPSIGLAAHGSVVLNSALTLTKALEDAFGAEDLERLSALGTYQGAMEVAVQGRAGGSAAPSPHARTQVHKSLGQLAALLKQAARTDEPHAHSGDSDRLLRIGGELAERGAAAVGTLDCEDLAFDIAACVSASSRVPGDTQSPKRADFIKVAAEVLAVLADTPITDILAAGRTQSPKHTTEIGPSMPGLNLDQLRKVLGHVARDASTLNNLLMAAQATDDGSLLVYLVMVPRP